MQDEILLSIKTKVALVTAIVLWSSAFVGIRAALQDYSPGGLALLRFFVASIFMGIIYWRLPNRSRFTFKDSILLLCSGAIGLGCYNLTLNYGEITVDSGIASFIIGQSPLLTLIFSVLFFGEKLNWSALLGILISVVGMSFIAIGQGGELRWGSGLLYLLAATIISGFYSLIQRNFLKKYHAIDVTVLIIWGGTLLLLFYLPDMIHDFKKASLSSTAVVIYLGIFPAAMGYLAWSYALTVIPASRCMSFIYFMPIVSTFLGWLCLGEIPAVLSLVGGLIALLGVWVANKGFVKGG